MGEVVLYSVILSFLMTFFFSAATIVVIHFHKKIRNTALLSLLCALIMLSFWSFFMGYSTLLLSEFLMRVSVMFFAFAGFFAVLFVDLIWRQRPSAWQMSIVSTLSGLTVVLAWLPGSIITQEVGIYSVPLATGLCEIVLTLNLAVVLGFGFLWLVASAARAPKSVKHAARNLVITGIILGPCVILTLFIDRAIALGFSFLSMIVLGLLVLRNPQLMYILPFKVYRLLVIDAESGISLFNYDWINTEVDDVLFGGLLQGFQTISHDVLKQGAIQEVRLDSGVLILQKESTIFVGLLASNASKFLE